jgi:hypothetical protein
MAKAMKKRFADGDLVRGTTNVRTRSDDEIGDTDRFGNYKPGSYAARQEQGQKNLDSVKGFFNRLTGGGDAKQPAQDDYAEALRKGDVMERRRLAQEEPAAPMEAGPTVDEGMNKTIREAIGKRPTGMSPGSDVNQVAPEPTAPASKAVAPQNKPEAKPLPAAKPLPNVKIQSLKSIAEDRKVSKPSSSSGSSSSGDEMSNYAKQKEAGKVSKPSSSSGDEMSNYAKQKEAERDAKKRKDMDLKSVIPSKEDMQTGLEMAVPAGALTRQAMALAKKMAAKKAAKSTAPYLKEIGRENLKLGMKRGGVIKKMAGGGSASNRADGIAQRGKTRGKMC